MICKGFIDLKTKSVRHYYNW